MLTTMQVDNAIVHLFMATSFSEVTKAIEKLEALADSHSILYEDLERTYVDYRNSRIRTSGMIRSLNKDIYDARVRLIIDIAKTIVEHHNSEPINSQS